MVFSLMLFGLWACDEARKVATIAVPSLENSHPSWARPVDCDDNRVAIPATKKRAFVDRISCDVNQQEPYTIEGTTKGGAKLMGDDFYQKAACTPARTYFFRDSPEAMYQLQIAPNTLAEIRLDSNCADLDPFAYRWDRSAPPSVQHARVSDSCEMDTDVGDGKITITTTKNEQSYLIGVDGKEGAEGNFRLTIVCRSYR
jgi:hypothetical protein